MKKSQQVIVNDFISSLPGLEEAYLKISENSDWPDLICGISAQLSDYHSFEILGATTAHGNKWDKLDRSGTKIKRRSIMSFLEFGFGRRDNGPRNKKVLFIALDRSSVLNNFLKHYRESLKEAYELIIYLNPDQDLVKEIDLQKKRIEIVQAILKA